MFMIMFKHFFYVITEESQSLGIIHWTNLSFSVVEKTMQSVSFVNLYVKLAVILQKGVLLML